MSSGLYDDPYPPDSDEEHALQTRCPHCLGEQYVLNVLYFSAGEAGCSVCGRKSTPMSDEQWKAALSAARRRQG